MASKLAVYDTGYEDERFEQIVSQGQFHCIICTSVLKDAVMCPENEHLFCRACITRHLMNFQTCPTCMEPLTVKTLSQASRGVRNLLAELKIRCEFFNRGCGKFIELGDLERHVEECGFAPAVCSNEGCQLEVNKQDLLHHETAVCELRKVQCHSCNEIKQEINAVKVNLAAINDRLERIETNGKSVENVVAKVEQIQEQLNKQEESNRQFKADNVEMKKKLNEITKLLQNKQQTPHKIQADQINLDFVDDCEENSYLYQLPSEFSVSSWEDTNLEDDLTAPESSDHNLEATSICQWKSYSQVTRDNGKERRDYSNRKNRRKRY